MKQITVTNPNMATVEQNRLGLSHFGLLSRLFTLELASRVHQEEGLWQRLALELLEDAENEEEQPRPAPEIQLNLDLKILTKALREELARQPEKKESEKKKPEKKEPEKKPAALTTEQRVLECILLRERELWKADSRIPPHGVPVPRMTAGGTNTVTRQSGERYVLVSERREAPRWTVVAYPAHNQRSDRDGAHPAGQPRTIPAAAQPVLPASFAAGTARPASPFGIATAAGYAARSRSISQFDRQGSGMASVGMAPLLYRGGAAVSPAFGAGDAALDAVRRDAALRQYTAPLDWYAPHSEADESRAEARGSESPARQSETRPPLAMRAAQHEIRAPRRGSAAAEAASRDRTPALPRQQDTAAQTIAILARFHEQKETRRTQEDARRPLAGAAAEMTAFPGVVESHPNMRPNLTLASQTTTNPAGEGWAPQWQSEHPMLTAKTTEQANALGGSILFPDLLRYRREQAMSGTAAREDDRVPAALSAVLKDAVNRERMIRTAQEEWPDEQYGKEPAARREAVREHTHTSVLSQQEKQQTEQQNALPGAPTESQPVTESRPETARQQHTAATEQLQTPQHDDDNPPAEAAGARTIQAVPVTDSAAPTLSPASAELEYKEQIELQPERQPEQPLREQTARQSEVPTPRAESQSVTENRPEAARQQHTAATPIEAEQPQTAQPHRAAATPTETERARMPGQDEADLPAEEVREQTVRTRTPGYDEANLPAEAAGEQTIQAVPITDSATPALSPVSAELEYRTEEQAEQQTKQPLREQTARQSEMPKPRAESQSAMENRPEAARQQYTSATLTETKQPQTAQPNRAAATPTETERARTPGQDEANPLAEAAGARTAWAVPMTASAAPTLSPASAELEYKEQAERQAEEPLRQQTARQSEVPKPRAESQSAMENRPEAARQQYTSATLTETKQAQTAQPNHAAEMPTETERARTSGYDEANPPAEAAGARTAWAVPMTASAAPTLSPASAELEYKEQTELQSERQPEQPLREQTARQSEMPKPLAESQSAVENRPEATRQQYTSATLTETKQPQTAQPNRAAATPTETERARTPQYGEANLPVEAAGEQTIQAVPITDSAAPTFIPTSAELEYRTEEQAERQPEQPLREQTARQSEMPTPRAESRSGTENRTEAARQQRTQATPIETKQPQTAQPNRAAATPTETARTRTPRQDEANLPAEAVREQTARAVPMTASAEPTFPPASAELEYRAEKQAEHQPEQTLREQTARQSEMPKPPAESRSAAENRTEAARQQHTSATPIETKQAQTAQPNRAAATPTETERARTPQQEEANPPAEAAGEQTIQAVPITDSAAPTFSPASAELEYRTEEQAERQPEQPLRQQTARQSEMPTPRAESQSAAENRPEAARQQYAVQTPTEAERARTPRQGDEANPPAEAAGERTIQAVPITDSAASALFPAAAELEYRTEEQAEHQPEQTLRQQTARQSELPKPRAESRPVAENRPEAARRQRTQEAPEETEQSRTARGMPVADAAAAHGISPVLRMLAHSDAARGDAPHETIAPQRPADPARHSPFAKASRQPPRPMKTGARPAPLPLVSEQQNPTPWDARFELTYAQLLRTPQEAAAVDTGQTAEKSRTNDSFSQELPSWARAVLQQNGGQLPPPGAQSEPFGSRSTGGANGQINWSAPYAIPSGMQFPETGTAAPAVGQSPMVFRARNEAGQEQSPYSWESDERTAKKMADKVYKIIEERLRKELRRGGK